VAALAASFERERERSVAHVRDSIAPYARYVSGERERLEAARTALSGVEGDLDTFVARVSDYGR